MFPPFTRTLRVQQRSLTVAVKSLVFGNIENLDLAAMAFGRSNSLSINTGAANTLYAPLSLCSLPQQSSFQVGTGHEWHCAFDFTQRVAAWKLDFFL